MSAGFRADGSRVEAHRSFARADGRMHPGAAAGVVLIFSATLWLVIIHLARAVMA
jgi:hypothetical protein